ncbi:MAG: STAS domain-containing protein [Actinomycetota bacterium]
MSCIPGGMGVSQLEVEPGPIAHLEIEGDLDIAKAEELERQLLRMEESSPDTVVIDLRNVTFIDSSGLRLILRAEVRAQKAGRRLVLVRGPERVHRVFQVTGLDSRLQFIDDLARPSAKP